MADKVQQSKEVEEVVEKTKAAEEKPVEDVEEKVENGKEKAAENGDAKDDADNDESEEPEVTEADKCNLKRKLTGGGDATDNAPVEGATPEKKAKTTESTEAEAKEEAQAAA